LVIVPAEVRRERIALALAAHLKEGRCAGEIDARAQTLKIAGEWEEGWHSAADSGVSHFFYLLCFSESIHASYWNKCPPRVGHPELRHHDQSTRKRKNSGSSLL
jgi:hypothetical protein